MDRDSTTVADASGVGWRFDNTYSRLPGSMFVPTTPARAREPRVVILNERLGRELGLDLAALTDGAAASVFAGQELPSGSFPIAQAYAGHQYGHFTMLGDGRAILLGEHRTPSGRLVDIQFKGSGLTKFSRGGDGRAVLKPMLREYLISEAMAALGIPTTRSLAVVTTGQPIYRDSIQQGAILTRVAASHIRVGTFQYAAARGNESELKALADYAIDRHDPGLNDSPTKYLDFLRAVVDRQASLIARWQLVGFIHGVMNTDNMAISGETIDYGPCAFMNSYNPATVFSSIDRHGRYAYENQPRIAQWNLSRFAETLLPLIDPDEPKAINLAMEVLDNFPILFERYWLAGMRRKLGLQTEEAGDADLIRELLAWMQATRADYTRTFRSLSEEPLGNIQRDEVFLTWQSRWLARLDSEAHSRQEAQARMRSVNPAIIPRNHRVEEALAAAEDNNLTLLHRLLQALSTPFEDMPELSEYREPPDDERGYRTFCGT